MKSLPDNRWIITIKIDIADSERLNRLAEELGQPPSHLARAFIRRGIEVYGNSKADVREILQLGQLTQKRKRKSRIKKEKLI